MDVSVPNVNMHLKNIFDDEELDENSVIKKFLIATSDGKNYDTKLYNLDAIISLGYRINFKKATHFKKLSNEILNEYIVKDDVLNKEFFLIFN